VRGAGFGAPPDLVVDGGDAEGDVELGAARELGEDIEVADDHGPASDH